MRITLGEKDCCVDNVGIVHKLGEKWLNGHLMYQCEEGGYEITGTSALIAVKFKRLIANFHLFHVANAAHFSMAVLEQF